MTVQQLIESKFESGVLDREEYQVVREQVANKDGYTWRTGKLEKSDKPFVGQPTKAKAR